MPKPHTERWGYRKLYTSGIFALCTSLYPFLRRPGFYVVSRTVALFYAFTQPSVRQVIRRNLALLSPRLATETGAIRVLWNYATTIADYVAAGAMTDDQVLAMIGENHGIEHLQAATQNGRGVILATGHFSFFELGAVMLSKMGYPVTVATAPEPTSDLTAWRAAWRARWGTDTIPVGADPFSSLQIARAIQDGRCLAMLVDRPMGERGQAIKLPNGRIAASIAPAIMAWMTGCDILPVSVIRLPGGKYRLTTHAPVQVRRGSHENRDAEIARCTEAVCQALFTDIAEAPHQWYQFVPVGLS